MRFERKVVIVTGGAGGIGRATVQLFGREGAHVIVADVDGAKAIAVAGELRAQGAPEAIGCACNVASEADVVRCVDIAFARFQRLDIIVNNAGTMIFKAIAGHTEADLLHVLQVNFSGAFWFTKQALLRCPPGAAIVNVASVHALQTTPLVASYAAAKAALLSLTRSASIEGRPRGLRVNAVLPGAIETPMLRNNPNLASGAEVLDECDVGRPEDVAESIAFMASDEARFVSGSTLCVDGGRLARL